jgi:hypothetical protein
VRGRVGPTKFKFEADQEVVVLRVEGDRNATLRHPKLGDVTARLRNGGAYANSISAKLSADARRRLLEYLIELLRIYVGVYAEIRSSKLQVTGAVNPKHSILSMVIKANLSGQSGSLPVKIQAVGKAAMLSR